jgi:hypothetical protein
MVSLSISRFYIHYTQVRKIYYASEWFLKYLMKKL